MILLNVKVNNMYGFDELNYDLTYKRKTPSSSIIQNLKDFPGINYKKMNIIIGPNASGKTSLGKSICFIQKFLDGQRIIDEGTLFNVKTLKDKNFGFKVLFYTDGHAYEVSTLFDNNNLLIEKWKKLKLTKSITNSSLNSKIKNIDYFYIYDKTIKPQVLYEYQSSLLSNTKFQEDYDLIQSNLNFHYLFSTQDYIVSKDTSKMDLNFFKNLLQTFDPSIKNIQFSKDNKNEILISFTNGVTERLTKHGISENSILSSGTKEAIFLSKILYEIYSNNLESNYFLDQTMSSFHSDIERAILNLILHWIDKKDAQVFITTHNNSLLDIGLPVFNYTFLKRNIYTNKIGLIKPEDEVIYQSRSLKTMIEKDIFSTSPALDNLIKLI